MEIIEDKEDVDEEDGKMKREVDRTNKTCSLQLTW